MAFYLFKLKPAAVVTSYKQLADMGFKCFPGCCILLLNNQRCLTSGRFQVIQIPDFYFTPYDCSPIPP